MSSRKRTSGAIAGAIGAAALMLGVLAAPAPAAVRHVDGTVLSKDAGAKSFRIVTESGARMSFRVNGSTEFERIAGFGALHRGLAIEVDYVKTAAGRLAKQVETQGGNGGGGDDGGGDDHGGHGGDDGPGHE